MAQLNLHLLAQPAVERAQALSQRLNLDQGFMKLGFGGDQVGVGHGGKDSAKMGPVSRQAPQRRSEACDRRLEGRSGVWEGSGARTRSAARIAGGVAIARCVRAS